MVVWRPLPQIEKLMYNFQRFTWQLVSSPESTLYVTAPLMANTLYLYLEIVIDPFSTYTYCITLSCSCVYVKSSESGLIWCLCGFAEQNYQQTYKRMSERRERLPNRMYSEKNEWARLFYSAKLVTFNSSFRIQAFPHIHIHYDCQDHMLLWLCLCFSPWLSWRVVCAWTWMLPFR